MPVNSFWSSEDKIPIQQTKVSIPSDNGLDYSDGQRIIFTIPAEHEYFNPINTVLEFDFDINLPTNMVYPTRLQLDSETGGNVLIRDIRLYGNSAEMPLLEEVQNCNILASLRYDYDSNDNVIRKRAITQGCGIYDPKKRSAFKNTQTLSNEVGNSQYFTPNKAGDTINFNSVGADSGMKRAKLLLPLHQSGIFGSSVVFPNKLVGGLRVELILEEGRKVFRQLNSVKLGNRAENNPRFHSVDSLDAAGGQNWGITDADKVDSFYLSRMNNITSVQDLPFCVGEAFSLKDTATDAFVTWTDAAGAESIPQIASMSIVAADVAGGRTYPLVKITIKNSDAGADTGKVYPNVAITGEGTTPGKYVMYSTSLNTSVGTKATGIVDFVPKYTVSNANLLIERVEMPGAYTSKMMSAMKSGGTINYDFLSFTNYRYSQLKDDRVANIRVPIMNTRCKATLCVPVDASVYSSRDLINCGDGQENPAVAPPSRTYFIDQEGSESQAVKDRFGQFSNYSERSGLVGIADGLSNYQFFYDGRLNPSRKVETTKISNRVSIAQQPLIELEKSLAVSGIPPHSFSKFRSNFCVGRAVGLQSGITDLSTTDYNLQIEYNDAVNIPTKNKTWNIFISHLRRLAIRGDSVMLQV